ncbi:MAG: NADPH:quinone oxidoreductase family protein, partial [Burkholderiaceae bacterium]
MRAVVCHKFCDYRDLSIELNWPSPEPGPGQILIDVHATGVGFANILQIAGTHQNKSVPPFIPGTEAAGVVVACGDGVTGIKPGTRVIGAAQGGGFAEQTVVRSDLTFAIPQTMSFEQATLFPMIYGTAYLALQFEGRLQAGETLLVLGAAGATGAAAVQVGKAMGANVIACASTDVKRQAAAKSGADHVLSSAGFRDAVLELTAGRGVDVVFDPVGGDAFTEALRCTAPQGRILAIGFASGDIPAVPLNLLLVKNVSVLGVYWGYFTGWARHKPTPEAAARVTQTYAGLFAMFEKGQLDPPVHVALPLDQFAQALEILEKRQA